MISVYKIIVFAALVCLTQCWPEINSFEDGKFKKIFSAERNTAVKDGDGKLVMFVGANLAVYGDFNKTTDHDVVANFVAYKLPLLERHVKESREVYVEQSPLPLFFNMTFKELITTGPKPVKNIGILLDVKAYAHKKKHEEAISALKSLGSSF